MRPEEAEEAKARESVRAEGGGDGGDGTVGRRRRRGCDRRGAAGSSVAIETLLDEAWPKAGACARSAPPKRAREAAAARVRLARRAGRLCAFLEEAARLRGPHRFLAERSAAGSEEALASVREAFESGDGSERALEPARAATETQTEEALAAAEARATSELDAIEDGAARSGATRRTR